MKGLEREATRGHGLGCYPSGPRAGPGPEVRAVPVDSDGRVTGSLRPRLPALHVLRTLDVHLRLPTVTLNIRVLAFSAAAAPAAPLTGRLGDGAPSRGSRAPGPGPGHLGPQAQAQAASVVGGQGGTSLPWVLRLLPRPGSDRPRFWRLRGRLSFNREPLP